MTGYHTPRTLQGDHVSVGGSGGRGPALQGGAGVLCVHQVGAGLAVSWVSLGQTPRECPWGVGGGPVDGVWGHSGPWDWVTDRRPGSPGYVAWGLGRGPRSPVIRRGALTWNNQPESRLPARLPVV